MLNFVPDKASPWGNPSLPLTEGKRETYLNIYSEYKIDESIQKYKNINFFNLYKEASEAR